MVDWWCFSNFFFSSLAKGPENQERARTSGETAHTSGKRWHTKGLPPLTSEVGRFMTLMDKIQFVKPMVRILQQELKLFLVHGLYVCPAQAQPTWKWIFFVVFFFFLGPWVRRRPGHLPPIAHESSFFSLICASLCSPHLSEFPMISSLVRISQGSKPLSWATEKKRHGHFVN